MVLAFGYLIGVVLMHFVLRKQDAIFEGLI
jgi:hypothetical protein